MRPCAVFTSKRLASAGQSMVEFAIILPVFLMLTVGVLDVARAAWAYLSLQDAVREGVRSAIIIPVKPSGSGLTTSSTANVVPRALTAAPFLGLDSGQLGSVTNCGTGPLANTSFSLSAVNGAGAADYCTPVSVTLTASYTFQPIASLVLGTASLTMTASSTSYLP